MFYSPLLFPRWPVEWNFKSIEKIHNSIIFKSPFTNLVHVFQIQSSSFLLHALCSQLASNRKSRNLIVNSDYSPLTLYWYRRLQLVEGKVQVSFFCCFSAPFVRLTFIANLKTSLSTTTFDQKSIDGRSWCIARGQVEKT